MMILPLQLTARDCAAGGACPASTSKESVAGVSERAGGPAGAVAVVPAVAAVDVAVLSAVVAVAAAAAPAPCASAALRAGLSARARTCGTIAATAITIAKTDLLLRDFMASTS